MVKIMIFFNYKFFSIFSSPLHFVSFISFILVMIIYIGVDLGGNEILAIKSTKGVAYKWIREYMLASW